MKLNPSILSALLLTSALSNASFASNGDENIWQQPHPLKPNVTFWGLGGNQIIGNLQGLIPIGATNPNSIFYGAAEAAGSFKKSNGYAAGVAAGYRKVLNNSFILGGYFFADYNRSPYGHYFWVVNPGLEALGNIWDFRANAYFPTTRNHWLGREDFAENIGITKFEKALGHIRFDHLFQTDEEVSPGLDAEIGRLIPITKHSNLRAYIGGYHYFMDKTNQITGVESRIVFPISKLVSLEARDSYDKVRKNVFMGGIRVTFGGYNNEEKVNLGITGRLLDPIEHNFGNYASANSIAVNKEYVDKGNDYQLPGSFWYFDNTPHNKNSTGDGTFEHPFNAIDLRSLLLVDFSKNVQMYIASGISPYDLSSLPEHRLALFTNYSIYGRTSNFTRAASGSLRPTLNGGIIAYGGNTIKDIQLNSQNNNFGSAGALFLDGILSKNIIKVDINDVNINVAENKADATGIGGMNAQVTINNSQITTSSTDQSKQSIGIGLLDNSALFIGNNNYIHTSITSTAPGENHSAGIFGISPVIVYGNNNQIIADATGSESRAIGIAAIGNPIEISGSYNHIVANADGFDSRAGGIINVGTTIISGNNNQIIGNAAGIEGKALGIGDIEALDYQKIKVVNDNSKVIISGNNNQMIGNSAESNSIGIINLGELMISGNNNQIIANSAKQIAGQECNAGGIVTFGNKLTILGINNQIIANSAGKAYGILELSGASSPTFDVENTIFNIKANGAGNEAAGISMGLVTDATKIIIRNNVFNVAETGTNAKAYGIYLPNATTPAIKGNIAYNIFNITNSNVSTNAWGVYANSQWSNTATWIREHNVWLHPSSAAPQQQVFTNGAGL